MKKIVVFQFTVFDEGTKQLAKEIASEFPGVTKVLEVEGEEGQLEVRGEFSTFELTKELMKIDESVETIKIVPDGVTEPEVKNQQQDEGKPPINIPKASKWGSDVASSSNGIGVPAYEFLGQAIDVAILAKDMGVGAAMQAKDIGVDAAGKAIVLGMDYYRNKNKEKEVKAKLEMKQKKAREEEERRRKQAEEMKQKKAREEEERRKRKQAEEMKQKKAREEKMRKQDEEMKQRKIRLEKEKEKMKEKDLAIKEEEKKQKIWQEMMRKQALKNNSGRTTWTGPAGSFWGTLSTKLIGETSASAQTQRPGRINAKPRFNTKTKKGITRS